MKPHDDNGPIPFRLRSRADCRQGCERVFPGIFGIFVTRRMPLIIEAELMQSNERH